MVDAVDLVKGDIQRDFERALKKIKKPADTIAGAQDYAQAVGDALVEAFRKNIGEDILVDGFLTPDLAEALIKDPMIAGWRFVTSKTADIQTAINNRAGYSIRALLAKTDERRVDGMVTLASEKPFAEVSTKFYQATPNVMRAAVDKTVEQNFINMAKAGVPVEVVRIPEGNCCDWCDGMAKAGPYKYSDVHETGNDVWGRHLDCKCIIETHFGNMRSQTAFRRRPRSD